MNMINRIQLKHMPLLIAAAGAFGMLLGATGIVDSLWGMLSSDQSMAQDMQPFFENVIDSRSGS